MEEDNWIKKWMSLNIEGKRGKGRTKITETSRKVLWEDLKTLGQTRKDARDCATWKMAIT